MDKNEIVGELARMKLMERYVSRFSSNRELMKELAQEVYLALLDYPEERLRKLHEKHQVHLFAFGLAKKMFFSVTSPFYYKYMDYENNRRRIDIYQPEYRED